MPAALVPAGMRCVLTSTQTASRPARARSSAPRTYATTAAQPTSASSAEARTARRRRLIRALPSDSTDQVDDRGTEIRSTDLRTGGAEQAADEVAVEAPLGAGALLATGQPGPREEPGQLVT